jgi:hypothetical protein
VDNLGSLARCGVLHGTLLLGLTRVCGKEVEVDDEDLDEL